MAAIPGGELIKSPWTGDLKPHSEVLSFVVQKPGGHQQSKSASTRVRQAGVACCLLGGTKKEAPLRNATAPRHERTLTEEADDPIIGDTLQDNWPVRFRCQRYGALAKGKTQEPFQIKRNYTEM